MSSHQFVTVETGFKYALPFTSASGKAWRILVKKIDAPNPSVRGGAFKTRWKAYNGALNLSEHGDTRQEAVDKAIATLTRRGIWPAEQHDERIWI